MSIHYLETKETSQAYERRPVSIPERLTILGLTLPETIEQGHTAITGFLQLTGKLMEREGGAEGQRNIRELIDIVGQNQRTIEQLGDQITAGYFNTEPQAGIDAMLSLTPSLMQKARLIRDGIMIQLFNVPVLGDHSKMAPSVRLLCYLGIENVEQLYVLDTILRLPERSSIDIYHGYSKTGEDVTTFVVARKHLPPSLLPKTA